MAYDPEHYARALRNTMSERRVLWAALADLMAQRFFDDREGLDEMLERIMANLAAKEPDAEQRGLEIALSDVQRATDVFFSEVHATRLRMGAQA